MSLQRYHAILFCLLYVVGCGPSNHAASNQALSNPRKQAENEGPTKAPSSDFECPADVAPEVFSSSDFSLAACQGSRLQDCIVECRDEIGSSCYSAAVVKQRQGEEAAAEILFLRACAFGIASGCTNRAASILEESQRHAVGSCATRTFRISCDRGHDPWACTMLGLTMMQFEEPANQDELRSLFAKACAYEQFTGPRPEGGDEACQAATSLLQRLDEE